MRRTTFLGQPTAVASGNVNLWTSPVQSNSDEQAVTV
jgi:hypothetical protein